MNKRTGVGLPQHKLGAGRRLPNVVIHHEKCGEERERIFGLGL